MTMKKNSNGEKLHNIAVIGGHLPRQCGVATFTTHLSEALSDVFPKANVSVVAVNDTEEGYEYPPQVRFEMNQHDLESYLTAADFLNINHTDLVCLQHEYGIFGGEYGSHILRLLREVQTPVVTTLHTILREPDTGQREVLHALSDLSDRLIVMNQKGREFLIRNYNIPDQKIDIIPHGIPEIPFVDPNYYKDQFGVEDKLVLLTFGLLSPNKGIEYVIEALPVIVEKYPNVVYIILGATHPHVKRNDGETYRLKLQRLAKSLGVEKNVIFYNRFVGEEQLMEFISSADIYITPYLNKEQITSGTLAYACGAGKPVISTPYWHAGELLSEGKGILVPFKNAESIADEVIALLDNEPRRHAIRKKAYLESRRMVWHEVAKQYMESFEAAKHARIIHPRVISITKTLEESSGELPELKFDHLLRLTDDTGLYQHTKFAVPDYNHGYTTDDNARALYLTILLEQLGYARKNNLLNGLSYRYLAFINYAYNRNNRRFRNVMDFSRNWLDETGSDDCHGRVLWSLGTVLAYSSDKYLKGLAADLFDKSITEMREIRSIRAVAFALLGIHAYLKAYPGDNAVKTIRNILFKRLMQEYEVHGTEDWPWYEPVLAYSNAKLPQALMLSAWSRSDERVLKISLESLKWLMEQQTDPAGHFVPIGSEGFYRKDGERARFDQQPIEAYCSTSACLEAYRITRDSFWLEEARSTFEWFLGRNDLGLPLYDPSSGGCMDGLHPERLNENQGAESTLAFLMALAEMKLAERRFNILNGLSHGKQTKTDKHDSPKRKAV